jgi:formylglycine-generating enzyme required for sulfatase activity
MRSKKFLAVFLFVLGSLFLLGCSGSSSGGGNKGKPEIEGMVWIEGGTFTMGAPESEAFSFSDERPQRQVTVSGFYMSIYEITQAEWLDVMGTDPSYFMGDDLPVERVSWYDAIEFCNKLSELKGLTPAYIIDKDNQDPNNTSDHDSLKWTVTWDKTVNGYRLPTEAEWEYAARAGTTTPFGIGDGNSITSEDANFDGSVPYDVSKGGLYYDPEGEFRDTTTDVGSFAPNAWGLYDMHGNVWEWVWDWYGAYAEEAGTNPDGAVSGESRVLRGGSWFSVGLPLRSANRNRYYPSVENEAFGFRVVRP